MSTEPDDDLDTTAELPQLNLQEAHASYVATGTYGQTTELDSDPAKTGGWLATDVINSISSSAENWPLVDELLTVRDRIVDLEADLLDAQLKFAKLDKQYQELQARHVELTAQQVEVVRDRERIDVERILLLESRQQLKQQFESFQAEAITNELVTQQQLEQQQHELATVRADQAADHERQLVELGQHQLSMQQLSAALLAEQTRATSLESSLQATTLAHADQVAAAAVLARNLSHEILDKQALGSALAQREQHIQWLEVAKQQLTVQLDEAEDRHDDVLVNLSELQSRLHNQVQQNEELQSRLKQAEEKISYLNQQLDTEHGNFRSAEQDKQRLTELANTTRDSYENTREQLAARSSEVSALRQEQANAEAKLSLLSVQLAEAQADLQQRDELLIAKQQALKFAEELQTASVLREAALTETLNLLRGELQQSQTALHERDQLLAVATQRQVDEVQARQQLHSQLEEGQQQLQALEKRLHQRDQFILDQATELERAQLAVAEVEAQLKRTETLHQDQCVKSLAMQTELALLRAQHEQQLMELSRAQQQLVDKQLEQGASARQVDALQQELHQHVAALNAIRRDIHQVAQQSRHRASDVLVRTLVRVDDPDVVHLLNKPAMVLGRSHDADICIQTESISRRHACLRVARDVVIIEDLGSTNGCYVNGKRIKRLLLKDGDQLEVGEVKFRFATRVSQS
jgi:chromosome segregation ATPase